MKGIPDVIVGIGRTAYGVSPKDNIADMVTSMEISLTMDAVSQLSITVADPGLRMFKANYFQLRQPVQYLDMKFEMASIEVSPGSVAEQVRIDCRNFASQKMKQEKGATVFNGGSASFLAAQKARQFELRFFGEETPPKDNISRVQNENNDESTWDVLKRLAGDNQYVMFETENRLFFCSQQFLMGKYAVIGAGISVPDFLATPVYWGNSAPDPVRTASGVEFVRRRPLIPEPPRFPRLERGDQGPAVEYLQRVLRERASASVETGGYFGPRTETAVRNVQKFFGIERTGVVGPHTWNIIRLLGSGREPRQTFEYTELYGLRPLEVPTLRRSDDSWEEASFDLRVDRDLGIQIRPGMTVKLDGVGGFNGYYLVGEVRWSEGTNDPVSITGRTPQKPSETTGENGESTTPERNIDYTGGGFAATFDRPLIY